MDLSGFAEWTIWPGLIAGVLMVVLAVVLLRADRAAPAHRWFAGYLVLFGVGVALSNLNRGPFAAEDTLLWRRIYPFFAAPTPLFIVGFLATYPRDRGWFATRAGTLSLLGIAALIDVTIAIDPTFFYTYALRNGEAVLTSIGPLIATPVTLTSAVAAVIFALDARKAREPALGTALTLVSGAFAITALFNAMGAIVGTSLLVLSDWLWARIDTVIVSLAALPAIVALVLLVRQRRNPRLERSIAALAVIAAIATIVPVVLTARSFGVLTTGAVRLVIPGFVTYALLKHRLLDIDLKIKWTVKQSTIAAAFVAVFFVVSESAATFFSGRAGTYIGIAAAGCLVFLLAPLQRFAERVANTAMPHVGSSADYIAYRKIEIYKVAVEGALKDGVITEDERETLQKLRAKLDLAHEAADAIERDLSAA